MSKIKIVKEEELDYLKKNIAKYSRAFSHSDNSKLLGLLDSNPFVKSKIDILDIELDMSAEVPFDTEFINSKIIFENLNFLTLSQASDERLWAGLCLNEFWEYTKYRWKIYDNINTQNILSHFFFGFGKRRSLTRNAIARLWWISKLTYDPTREDPYELTKLLCENSNHIQNVLERNTSNNPEITKYFLSGVIRARKQGFKVTKNSLGELSKYLNLLGGIYVLDVIPSEIIEEKIYKYAMEKVKIID